jgi:hypothetical protein
MPHLRSHKIAAPLSAHSLILNAEDIPPTAWRFSLAIFDIAGATSSYPEDGSLVALRPYSTEYRGRTHTGQRPEAGPDTRSTSARMSLADPHRAETGNRHGRLQYTHTRPQRAAPDSVTNWGDRAIRRARLRKPDFASTGIANARDKDVYRGNTLGRPTDRINRLNPQPRSAVP